MRAGERGDAGLDLDRIRERLASLGGREYWRCLEELAGTDGFRDWLHREFPPGACEWTDAGSRRAFLKLMGASIALAGLGGCTRQPPERIVPYVRSPEEIVPGKPLYFATAITAGGLATGILVESHMGRPTKIEGNPEHPASLGATDAITQASILDLYDPDRSQVIRHAGRIGTWPGLLAALNGALAEEGPRGGAGVRILTETVTSPSLAARIRAFLAKNPAARWHPYDPLGSTRSAARAAFTEPVSLHYRFDRARVVVALDADFLGSDLSAVRHTRDFASLRRTGGSAGGGNRLYSAESTHTLTGAMADHRLPVRAGDVEGLARILAREVTGGRGLEPVAEEASRPWLEAAARDLKENPRRSIVIAGDGQPPAVHAIAHELNAALENAGETVIYTDPVEAEPVNQTLSLAELAEDMAAGKVSLLVILGGNPVFTAPGAIDFGALLGKVKLAVRLGVHEDETSELCAWHVPEAHFLESWGDARAFDGTVTLVQPLIAPLYEGKSAHDVISALLGEPGRSAHEVVREHWRAAHGSDATFEAFWQRSLHDGMIAGTAFPPRAASLRREPLAELRARPSGIEVVFRPDPSVRDGRHANNAWLQELPRPLTKLTWDNAALIAPSLAGRMALANGDVVEIRSGDRRLEAPVWILPGQPQDSVTLHLGYGRWRSGKVGTGVGFRAEALMGKEAAGFIEGAELVKTKKKHPLVTTQPHHAMEGRDLVRETTFEEMRRKADGPRDEPAESLHPAWKYEGYAWGMSIDLAACTGCNACTAACQAENNIPVVGKEEVARGREMHWIRVDHYHRGTVEDPGAALENPRTVHQPVPCMHCENAPCELVCPVAATAHGDEGLNEMVYNRCVGTRYCSNNCPYKVRRFNFFRYADLETPSLKLLRNPDVTVRTRGVMEKCTYCVQRINAARIEAKKEGRRIRDGEVVTACQGACPAQAIVFGDINDPASRVARLKASPLDYGLLSGLNTRPRTTYLPKARNPNPALGEA